MQSADECKTDCGGDAIGWDDWRKFAFHQHDCLFKIQLTRSLTMGFHGRFFDVCKILFPTK